MRKYVEERDLEDDESDREKIIKFLNREASVNGKRWYLRQGIMIDVFGVDGDKMQGRSFNMLPSGYASIYGKTRIILEDLVKAKLVDRKKSGRAFVYKWKT